MGGLGTEAGVVSGTVSRVSVARQRAGDDPRSHHGGYCGSYVSASDMGREVVSSRHFCFCFCFCGRFLSYPAQKPNRFLQCAHRFVHSPLASPCVSSTPSALSLPSQRATSIGAIPHPKSAISNPQPQTRSTPPPPLHARDE